MADQFQIPQRNPQYVAPVDPTNLVEQYLNRDQQARQGMNEAINQVGSQAYNRMIEQQKLKASAFQGGGPILMHQMGYMNDKDYQSILDSLNGNSQQPPMQSSIPANYSPPPAQGMTPSPQTQGATPQPQAQAQGGQPAIDPHAPGGSIHASVNTVGNPDIGNFHANKILDLQQQMKRNMTLLGPEAGGKANTSLKDQLSAETALVAAEQFQQGQQRQQQQFETSQNAEESRFQRGQHQKVAETVGGEVSKQRQKTTATDTAQLALNQFARTFFSKGKDGQLTDLTSPSSIPFVAGAKAKISQKTGGRFGGQAGGQMLDKSKTLGNTLVGILTASGRMNQATAEDFVHGMIPNPDEPTALKVKKLDDLQSFISTVRSGDKNALDTVISTLTGSQGSAIQ